MSYIEFELRWRVGQQYLGNAYCCNKEAESWKYEMNTSERAAVIDVHIEDSKYNIHTKVIISIC